MRRDWLHGTCTRINGRPCGCRTRHGSGESAVAWLRLTTKTGRTRGIRQVYRVSTAGGSPRATWQHPPATFEVEYAAID
ncbi:hypothetical protein CDD82_2159 [Ophiocordyceps australis]|uniref:Uncharacterized protein n=1 Tax=Ophiocordyceps australis TaxID=1399860 RepID=A0A2C5ZIW5_9HYPO|nr:hypothetical protein CDD82_2159 [Ophiocordyceps australis]